MNYTFIDNNVLHTFNANNTFSPVQEIIVGNNKINTISTSLVFNAGGIVATNNMTLSTTSGRFYSMNLASGVEVLNLPAGNTVPDGYNVTISAAGLPSGYQTSRVSAASGELISYRNVNNQNFYMIGNAEVFKFTKISSIGVWLAECLAQPSSITARRGYTGSGVFSPTQTSWFPLFYNVNSYSFAQFDCSNQYYTRVPVAGVWKSTHQIYFYANGGTYQYYVGKMYKSNTALDALTYEFTSMPTGGSNYSKTIVTESYAAGEAVGVYYQGSTALLEHYFDFNAQEIELVTR